MLGKISILGAMLTCAACQYPPEGTQVAAVPEQTEPICHDFTTPVTAGGRPEQARGQACEQPDGSWQVVQNTPGLPAQAYVLNPPGEPAAAAGSTPVQLQPSQSRTNQSPAGQSPAGQSACSSYTAPVTVGEQPRQAFIEACPQRDGSWSITQNTPGLPTQVYQVPPPASTPYPYDYPYPIDYAYPEFFPYWVGEPWFFGLAPSIVVVQRFHHFQHGFPRGFGHGFARGFGPGFGHGFAAARGGGAGGGRR
jgi:surface antigen